MSSEILMTVRKKVTIETAKHQFTNALFWGDKAVSLSGGDARDVFAVVNVLYLRGEYQRAIYLIQAYNQQHTYYGTYLIAKCQSARGDWMEAKETLESIPDPSPLTPPPSTEGIISEFDLLSSLYLLKGTVYQALDNLLIAAQYFRLALKADPYCIEAYESLVHNHYHCGKYEEEVLVETTTNSDLSESESEMIRFLYGGLSKKYHNQGKRAVPTSLTSLANNVTVLASQAERLYYNCRFRSAHEICLKILKLDPFHFPTLLVHSGCLYELRRKNDLFVLGHKLVELYPRSYLSWYTVGVYYSLIRKWESARQCLSKSTSLNKLFAAGWLAYGHAFAAEGENDQALATYFTASRLLKGCHLPLLYIGLQYSSTNNPLLAEKFYKEALEMAPSDPFVLAEMGALYTQTAKWDLALSYLKQALVRVEDGGHEWTATTWTPLYINLGQVYRITKQYNEAEKCFKHAQFLSTESPAVYAGLAFVYAMQGKTLQAVEYCHKALDKQRQDPFTLQLLEMCLSCLSQEGKSENEDDDDDEDGDVLIRLPQFNLPVHITPTSYK